MIFRWFKKRVKGSRMSYYAGIVALIAGIFSVSNAAAYNIYTFTDAACVKNSGAILTVNDNKEIVLLRLDGNTITLPVNKVEQIHMYNTGQNPIRDIDLSAGSGQFLIRLKLFNEKDELTGWFMEYADDLLVFYSLEGNQYLLEVSDIERISGIEPLMRSSLKFTPDDYKKYNLLPGIEDSCRQDDADTETPDEINIPPFRHIKDKVEVIKFIDQKKEAFFLIEGLSVRTNYYTKPVMFFPRNSIRLSLQRGGTIPSDAEQLLGGSLYFGSPYATQSVINVLNVKNRQLPIFDFLPALETEIKSFFFHAGFIGNFNGLQPKSRYMINKQAQYYNFFDKISGQDAHWVTNFNRLVFSGIDYKSQSFFIGQFYPLFGILLPDGYFREVAVGTYAIVGIYRYTKEKSAYEVIASNFQISQSVNPSDTDAAGIEVAAIEKLKKKPSEALLLSQGTGESDITNVADQMTHYNLTYRYIRFNYTYEFNPNLQVLFSQAIDQKSYEDDLYGGKNTFSGETYTTSLAAVMQFGNKIRTHFFATGIINSFRAGVSREGETVNKKVNTKVGILGAALEFLL